MFCSLLLFYVVYSHQHDGNVYSAVNVYVYFAVNMFCCYIWCAIYMYCLFSVKRSWGTNLLVLSRRKKISEIWMLFFFIEIWDALWAAAEADLTLAQTIVECAGVIIQSADLTMMREVLHFLPPSPILPFHLSFFFSFP